MNVFIQCAKNADTCRGMMRMTREISVVSCVIQTYAVVLSDRQLMHIVLNICFVHRCLRMELRQPLGSHITHSHASA